MSYKPAEGPDYSFTKANQINYLFFNIYNQDTSILS